MLAVDVDAARVASPEAGTAFNDRAEFVIVAIEPGEKVRLTERVTASMRLDPSQGRGLDEPGGTWSAHV